jgi:hypothetical protein
MYTGTAARNASASYYSSISYGLTRKTTDYAISRTSHRTRYWLSRLTHNAQKDTVSRSGYASPDGRHERLLAARAGHEKDMISHLC